MNAARVPKLVEQMKKLLSQGKAPDPLAYETIVGLYECVSGANGGIVVQDHGEGATSIHRSIPKH